MTNDAHADFLADPEAHASHLETCAQCRAYVGRVEDSVELQVLPVAPWEGAAHRSWGFVSAVASGIAIIALALCHFAGISPIHAVAEDASFGQWRVLLTLGRFMKPWQVITLFLIVNGLLVVLLRRQPRGIDA